MHDLCMKPCGDVCYMYNVCVCVCVGQASAMSAAGEDTTEAAVQTREHVSMLMEL